jgi:hypothetical protein
MTAIGDPLCSAEGAHEYLGRKAEAIVTSVQNGDNSPSTTTGLNYLGTVPPAVAPCPLCPRKQTSSVAVGMSAQCHKRL